MKNLKIFSYTSKFDNFLKEIVCDTLMTWKKSIDQMIFINMENKRIDWVYLTEIFTKLNDMNIKLQKDKPY